MSKQFHSAILFGTFDGIHNGHRFLLRQALDFAEKVTVILAKDSVVYRLKGHQTEMSFSERENVLYKEFPGVIVRGGDEEEESWNSVRETNPDVLVTGYDQTELRIALQKSFPHIPLITVGDHKGTELHSSLLRKKSNANNQN